MFDGPVTDYLMRRTHDGILVSRTINFFGIGESALEDQLRERMIASTNPTIAPYAKTSEVQLRVTARASDEAEGNRLIEPVVQEITAAFPEYVYGMDFHSINEAVVRRYTEAGKTLACAESCTGGLVAARLVEIAGASAVLHCGVVAYANQAKRELLGVREETLAGPGAVSRECALEMARGSRRLAKAEVEVATTGYAGQQGAEGEPGGVAAVGDGFEEVRELHLARGRADDREHIRFMASSHAFDLALRALRGQKC